MMNKITKTAAAVFFTLIIGSAAHAANPMKDVFSGVMSNSTSGTSFESSKRWGYSGGGLSVRVPQVNTPLITISPPSATIGCGGVDFFLGSFSLINKDQLVQVMRGIAQGAATFAFTLGMEAVCASCAATMQSWAEALRKLNADSRYNCQSTLEMLSKSDMGQEATEYAISHSLIKGLAAKEGIVSDSGAADAKTPKDNMSSMKNNDAAKKVVNTNVTVDILNNSNFNNWTVQGIGNWFEIVLSLFGTVIITNDTSGKGIISTGKKPILTLEQLVMGGNGSSIKLYKCIDGTTTCLNMEEQTQTSFDGLYQTMSSKLAPIQLALNKRQEQDEDSVKFLNQVAVDETNIDVLTRLDPAKAGGAIDRVAQNYAYHFVGQTMLQILGLLENSKIMKDTGKTEELDFKEKRKQLKADAEKLEAKMKDRTTAELNNYMLNEAILKR